MNAQTAVNASDRARREQYVVRIAAAWKKAVDSILEAGLVLKEAKETLSTSDWLVMISDELPFNRRMAEKLIKIASNPHLSDPLYRHRLPPHWTTLHTLTYLDEAQFKRAIEDGRIHPSMERTEADALKGKPVRIGTPDFLKKPKLGVGRPKQSDILDDHDFVPTEFGKAANVLAMVKCQDQLPDESIAEIQYQLRRLQLQFGVDFSVSGYSSDKAAKSASRQVLARELVDWHHEYAKRFFDGGRILAQEVRFYDYAIYQLETNKRLEKLGGAVQEIDLRHPDNPFYKKFDGAETWDAEAKEHVLTALYDDCRQHRILTQYTPLQYIDYIAFINMLGHEFCAAKPERQDQIKAELVDLDALENKIFDGAKWEDDLAAKGEAPTSEQQAEKIPYYTSDFRSPDIYSIVDMEPGIARSMLERLID